MRFSTSKCRTLLASAVIVFLSYVPGVAADRQLVIFGDSLSDPGNYYAETGEFAQAPYEPIPGAPYTIGGFHFSNGHTWVEQLAFELHAPTSAGAAVRSPGLFTNYAFGRARARVGAGWPLYDLSWQVDRFLDDFNGQAPADATYVIWFGSNDVRDALEALGDDPGGATSAAIVQAALGSIADNIIELHSAGARRFLVPGVPNLGVLPAVRALGADNPAIPFAAEQLSLAFNDGLATTLDSLPFVLPGIDFVRLDTFSLLNEIIADPGGSGFIDVEEPCLTFGVVAGAVCALPNGHLFWDGSHPTTEGHGIVSDAALEALTQH